MERVESEIKNTIQLQATLSDVTVDEAFRDILRALADKKKNKKVRLIEIENLISEMIGPDEAKKAIQVNVAVFKKAYAKAQATVKKRLLGMIFESVTLGDCELNLYYRKVISSAEAVQQIKIKGSSEQSSGDSSLNSKSLNFKDYVRSSGDCGPRATSKCPGIEGPFAIY